jgi:hypothetical protein
MPAELAAINRPGLIVCEGPDDERFLRTLLVHLDIQSIWVEHVEGESQFRRYVRRLRTRTGFELLRAFALVRDADTDAGTKFSHACSLLRDFRYPTPAAPLQIASGPLPALESSATGSVGSTGIMVLPIGRTRGALEDLCLEAIRGDPSLTCVDQFLECVALNAGIGWPDQYRSKARLNAWLASRGDPRHRLRDAISAGMFPLDHTAFDPIRQFLRDLAAAANAPEAPRS